MKLTGDAEVNAGAMEICRAFLSKSARGTFPQISIPPLMLPLSFSLTHYQIFIERLQESLRQFLVFCGQALALNKELIGLDQINFHTSLEQGFADLKLKMEKYPLFIHSTLNGPTA